MPLKIYDGSKWVIAANVSIWDGTSWTPAANAYTWDGSSWAQYHPGVTFDPSYFGLAVNNIYSYGAFASASVNVYANGHIQTVGTTDATPPYLWQDSTWKLSGDTSDYDIQLINLNTNGGATGSSMVENVVYPLNTDRTYELFATWGYAWYADFTLQIVANNTGTVLSTTIVSLTAEATSLA